MTRMLLAIALIAGLISGCSGGDDPQPTPTTAVAVTTKTTATLPSPSPTRTGPLTTGPNVRPGEKPPPFPEVARRKTSDGALALAVYYFQAFDWGYATNDPTLVAVISEPACKGCAAYVEGLRSVMRDHRRLTGGRIKIKSFSIEQNSYDVDADYVADVAIDEEPVVLRGSGTAQTVAPHERMLHSLVFLVWIGDGWKVAAVTKP